MWGADQLRRQFGRSVRRQPDQQRQRLAACFGPQAVVTDSLLQQRRDFADPILSRHHHGSFANFIGVLQDQAERLGQS